MEIYDGAERRNGSAWPYVAAAAIGGYAVYKIIQALQLGVIQSKVPSKQRVLILGAGFAGTSAAQELSRLLPEDRCEITLIDQNNSILFTPMLTEVAGGQVDPRDIVSPLRRLSPHIRFEQARIESVDLEAKTVSIMLGTSDTDLPQTRQTLEADHILIALGSTTNFHHMEDLSKHALTVKSLADAAEINNRVLALLERADAESDEATRRAILTIVVAGGGFSGVETMAAVNDFIRGAVRSYPNVKESEIRTILVHPGKRLLSEIGESLAHYAKEKLEARGVRVILEKEIAGADSGTVQVKDGEAIPCHTLIWTAGVSPNPLVEKMDCPKGKHHGISVDSACRAKDRPGVWAVGDCADVPTPGGGDTYAPTAQNATREGTLAARNMVMDMMGQEPKPFTYRPIGEMALVGRHSGVASLYGYQFSGLMAWLMWRAVYLAKMPGASKRVRIGLDWLLDLFLGRDISELPSRSMAENTAGGSHPEGAAQSRRARSRGTGSGNS